MIVAGDDIVADKILRKYEVLADLPVDGSGKPIVDDDNLGDYSGKILERVVAEIRETLDSGPGMFGFSCPGSDVEGIALWRENVTRERKYYEGIMAKVIAEIKKREG